MGVIINLACIGIRPFQTMRLLLLLLITLEIRKSRGSLSCYAGIESAKKPPKSSPCVESYWSRRFCAYALRRDDMGEYGCIRISTKISGPGLTEPGCTDTNLKSFQKMLCLCEGENCNKPGSGLHFKLGPPTQPGPVTDNAGSSIYHSAKHTVMSLCATFV